MLKIFVKELTLKYAKIKNKQKTRYLIIIFFIQPNFLTIHRSIFISLIQEMKNIFKAVLTNVELV
jgi:hypothetical protein